MLNLEKTQEVKDKLSDTPDNYQEIINQSEVGICITDENGRYIAVNETYRKITKYEEKELIGESFLLVVPSKKKEELQELHDDFIEVQIEIFSEFIIIDKEGSFIKLDIDAGFIEIQGKGHKVTFIGNATII